MKKKAFSQIKEILRDAKKGKMFILVDDKNRENEGDLVVAASKCNSKIINFMVLYRELGGSTIKFLVSAAVILLTPILAAKLVFNITSSTGAEPVNQPWVQNSMEFVTWNREKWTGWVRNEDFALRPQNEGKWSQHSNSMLAFMDIY